MPVRRKHSAACSASLRSSLSIKDFFLELLTVVLLLGVVCFAGLRLGNVISLRSLVSHNVVADSAARLLSKAGRGSFGWRLSQDERYVNTALQTPLLGSGEWDWWKGSSSRPVGTVDADLRDVWHPWVARSGVASTSPGGSHDIFFPMRAPRSTANNLRYVLAAAILMSAIDSLLNSAVILPLLLAVGSLSAPNPLTNATQVKGHSRTNPLVASNVSSG